MQDEIQLINDPKRGSAWSNAVLGLCAKEVHLCGDERALHLIARMCLLTGDQVASAEQFEVVEYKRRNKLHLEHKLYSIDRDLTEGDCLIFFQTRMAQRVREVPSAQQKINSKHNENVCGIIYGRLPPEIKIKMAEDFNKGRYKYLVATDAIGLGLNLHIKRIIFTSIVKLNNFREMVQLENAHIRQIAGRAGRLEVGGGFVAALAPNQVEAIRIALRGVNDKVEATTSKLTLQAATNPDGGEDKQVELVEDQSQPILASELLAAESELLEQEKKRAEAPVNFSTKQREISQAVIFPSFHHLAEFNKNLEVLRGGEVPFTELIDKFNEVAKIGGMYVLQNYDEFYAVRAADKIAEAIQNIKLTLYERYTFCIAPLPFVKLKKQDSPDKSRNLPNGKAVVSSSDKCMEIFLRYVKDYTTFGEAEFGLDYKKLIKEVGKDAEMDTFLKLRTFEDYYSRSRP